MYRPIVVLLVVLLVLAGACADSSPATSEADPTPPSAPTDERDTQPTPAPTTARSSGGVTTPITSTATDNTVEADPASEGSPASDTATASEDAPVADVISVEVSGQAGAYQFAVGISSPDTGCDQYADWWEVVDAEGNLLYRRILAHSHTNEQPFVRSGGPVAIAPDTVVWVRAHMHPGGYGGAAFAGSVASGFEQTETTIDFDPAVETMEPQPTGCAF
jgi:hypothetical protein